MTISGEPSNDGGCCGLVTSWSYGAWKDVDCAGEDAGYNKVICKRKAAQVGTLESAEAVKPAEESRRKRSTTGSSEEEEDNNVEKVRLVPEV